MNHLTQKQNWADRRDQATHTPRLHLRNAGITPFSGQLTIREFVRTNEIRGCHHGKIKPWVSTATGIIPVITRLPVSICYHATCLYKKDNLMSTFSRGNQGQMSAGLRRTPAKRAVSRYNLFQMPVASNDFLVVTCHMYYYHQHNEAYILTLCDSQKM